MLSRVRSFIAPVYLFACLLIGGSAQGVWQNMILQLAGVVILAWAALDQGEEPLARPAMQLLLLAAVAILVIALQLVPLPPAVWTHLGPRQQIARGLASLGVPLAAEPLSVDPASGVACLLAVIPALALFSAMVRLRAYRPLWLAIALITGTVAGIALGVLQVASGNPLTSPFYLYPESNWGRAVGFFANADHMATLLVISVPFLAAIVAAGGRAGTQARAAVIVIGAAVAIVLVVGLALNGSLAGYGLGLAVLAASLLILLPANSRLRLSIIGLAALLVVLSFVALETSSIGSGKIGAHANSAVESRTEILATTSRAVEDFMPFGSGFGSFQRVYPLYEKAGEVTPEYVVHAHNDYAEVALELGLAGILLMLLFLAWWAVAVWRAWRTAQASPFARAAAIASAAVLVHSFVDFPLRTAAISACFGMCLALLAGGRAAAQAERQELRQVRHVVIEADAGEPPR